MAEIVLAEPSGESTSNSNRRVYNTTNSRQFIRSITSGRDDYVPEPFDSEKLPVTLVSEIQRFLRVANQIEADEPRVAYLCKSSPFEKKTLHVLFRCWIGGLK